MEGGAHDDKQIRIDEIPDQQFLEFVTVTWNTHERDVERFSTNLLSIRQLLLRTSPSLPAHFTE